MLSEKTVFNHMGCACPPATPLHTHAAEDVLHNVDMLPNMPAHTCSFLGHCIYCTPDIQQHAGEVLFLTCTQVPRFTLSARQCCSRRGLPKDDFLQLRHHLHASPGRVPLVARQRPALLLLALHGIY